MTDFDRKRCYVCGEFGSDSVDHVPPKGIFPKGFRHLGSDLITVPSHQACNKAQEKDDEYFRTQIGILGHRKGQAGSALWQQVLSGLRREHARGLLRRIHQEYVDGKNESTTRADIPGQIAKKVDGERIYRVISRTARGLFYVRTRSILPLDWPVHSVYMQPQAEALDLLDREFGIDNFDSFSDGAFRYLWASWEKSEMDGMYSFVFFDKVCFAVYLGSVVPKDDGAV